MENAEPKRAEQGAEVPARAVAPVELTDSFAPASAGANGASAPEPTQQIAPQAVAASPEPTQAVPAAIPVSADALLADTERRQRLEMELAKMGMSPEEVRRLLEADATSTNPIAQSRPQSSPALPGMPATAPQKPARPTAATLQSFAAELMATKTAAQNRAIETAAKSLPAFRDSSPQEIRQSEVLLREASLLRRREKYRDAEIKCREALELVPKDAAGLELLGDILQGVARIDEALAAYKRASEADPKRISAEKKYGDLLVRQQDFGSVDYEAIPKNSFAAVLLSALLPGAGQLHNGDIGKGVFFLIATAVCVYLLGWSPWGFSGSFPHHGINMALMFCVILSGVVYVAAVADANISAQANKKAGKDGWKV
jgi:tetratricopeptide (TPR) repeat protein